jgi:GT2 family glycosyltransferase
MEEAQSEWVLIIDHDILLLNPLWYSICQRAIRENPGAGWFTCYTNRIGCKLQRVDGVQNNDIEAHRILAKHIYDMNRGMVLDCTNRPGNFSGFFILTRKTAWEKCGKFREDSFFAVDEDYCQKLRRTGYKVCIMQDLYVFHGYWRETLTPYFSKESVYGKGANVRVEG